MPYSFLTKAKDIQSIGLEKHARILLVTDNNVLEHCYPIVKNHLPSHTTLSIKPGDASKTLENAQRIWNKALELNLGRNDLIVALGGGVVCDLVGFAASTFKRGCPCIYVPTSLMAMVDAAHGGKTGINFGGIKNSIGTFSNPKHIYMHLPFLKTLGKNDLKSGFAEIIKHGIIKGGPLWEWICRQENISPKCISREVLEQIIDVKQSIVEQDFKESGMRKKLNLGHSIGHALEALHMDAKKDLSHGHCVAIGMLIESLIAHAHFNLSDEALNKIVAAIAKHFELVPIDFTLEQLLGKLSNDKKNHGKMSFTLPLEIGFVQHDCEVLPQHINEALDIYEKFRS